MSIPLKSAANNTFAGYMAALSVVLIWSGWIVVSRSGVQTALTAFDLAMLRYGISSIIALPFVLIYKPWLDMPVWRIMVLSFLLGPVYILMVFGAFNFAPATHGGIFMNGALPAITLLFAWLWLGEKPRWLQMLGVALIIIGGIFAVVDASQLDLARSWVGDLMFVGGGIFFCGYMLINRMWNPSMLQIIMCSSVINGIIYFPVWYFFLPSGMAQAGHSDLLLQGVYQGLLPTFLGLLLVAISVRNIGAATSSAFMAGVPAIATLLSIWLLAEHPGFYGWLSLLVVTPGILLVVLSRSSERAIVRPS